MAALLPSNQLSRKGL